MFTRQGLFLLVFVFMILILFFLTGCSGDLETVSPPPISSSTPDTEIVHPDGLTATAIIQPTPENIDITNTPEPNPTIEDITLIDEHENPTKEPDRPEEVQDNSGAESVSSEETQITPTTTPLTEETDQVSLGCLEKAAFYADVTVPDGTFFNQGEEFTKTWRFRNEGTCTWTSKYAIVFHSGDNMSAPVEALFTQTVPPGELVNLSVDMKAPTRGGQHQSNWEFKNPAGEHFGAGASGKDLFWTLISVRFLDQNDEPQPDPSTLQPPPSPSGCSYLEDQGYENQIVALINQVRIQNGLDPLTLDTELAASALVHSMDMACNDFVGHAGSDGSHWSDRIVVQGYLASYTTENIYVGFPDFGGTPDGAFEWWMNSQVHRNNILDTKVMELGVGYVFNEESEYGGYYTVNFAQPE